jgi:hypothetical protein
MEDNDTLLSVWHDNLKVLTAPVGAETRLARMMSFSAAHLKLMLAGERDFGEEFVRGVEAAAGLPPGWMDTRHTRADVPERVRVAIDSETPAAAFRGTAHAGRRRSVLRGAEPLMAQTETAARLAEAVRKQTDANRRRAQISKSRDAVLGEARRLARQLVTPRTVLGLVSRKTDELVSFDELDERKTSELADTVRQMETHLDFLFQELEKIEHLLDDAAEPVQTRARARPRALRS